MKTLFITSLFLVFIIFPSQYEIHAQLENTYPTYFENPINNNSDTVYEIWISHYASGLAPSQDIVTDIAVDEFGNAYVTGHISGHLFGRDYFTVKYNSSGDTVWTARYNGESNGDDIANAICVDSHGYVYVTGKSWDSLSGNDYVSVKYDSNGYQQWVARYSGPGYQDDEATALAVDDSGNVYPNPAITGVESL